MRRLRLALVGLLLALAIPVALLVARALRSVAVEERVRHEALAERIFDEMERTLSDFLAREEARAPGAYRFYATSDDRSAPDAPRTRSPLSRPAPEPFVIAHFQIDPSGALHTPLRPRDPDAAARAGDWPPPPEERERVDRARAALEREVAPFWRDAEARARALAAASSGAARADDGDARRAAAGDLQKSTPAAPPATEEEGASAYELLQSLNVGARKRAERREQIETGAPREELERSAAREGGGFGSLLERPARVEARSDVGRMLRSTAPSAETAEAAEAARPWADEAQEAETAPLARSAPPRPTARSLDALAEAAASSPDRAGRVKARADRPAARRIVLEPMAGLPVGDDDWMLYRTVLVDGEGYRQGLLIDLEGLGRWLSEQVIGDGRLSDVAVVRFGDAATTLGAGDGHLATHRFAEPFSGLDARLRVGPLRESGSATVIGLLAGLLGGVALLGVLAVHRMVSVVVEFAERRSSFVAAVSHELKTPLTAIRMYGEMLRDGLVPSEESRETYYRTITDESERLSRLIDNVLEFSRLEKGGRLLATTLGSPVPVVRDVVERLRPHAEGAGFVLSLDVDEPIPAVRFDRDALAQILFNLVDNAVKYAGRAPRKEIRVRCAATDDGGVVLSVRDFGPGVPREHLVRIFEPFFRVEEELTRSTRGSGIGLSLVQQLGDAMGASVTAANPADGGFVVRVTLPAGQA